MPAKNKQQQNTKPDEETKPTLLIFHAKSKSLTGQSASTKSEARHLIVVSKLLVSWSQSW